jgi:hypothetical protein
MSKKEKFTEIVKEPRIGSGHPNLPRVPKQTPKPNKS